MMQLSPSDLEAAVMFSRNHSNLSDNIKGSSGSDLDTPVCKSQPHLPNLPVPSPLEQGAEKSVLAGDICSGEESLLPMFRSEEDLLEANSPPLAQAGEEPRQEENGKVEILTPPVNSTSEKILQPEDKVYERGFSPVLKNRNFLTLWSGQVFSQLADKVYLVLMIALIAARFQTGDQTISGWVSSIMIAFTIPAVLFGSIAGVFVDRWPKKTVLVVTNLLRGGLVFTLPPLLWVSKGWAPLAGLPVGFCILLGITFLVSTLTQFFAPAEQSAIPLVVERRHLLSANSLYTTTMMASVIIGFAVGEPLLALADTLIAHFGWTAIGLGKELVVGSGYAIAGLILLLLKINEKPWGSTASNSLPPAQPEKAPDSPITSSIASPSASQPNRPLASPAENPSAEVPHVFQDIRDGLRYLGQQHRVRSALIQLVILFSVFAALAVLSVRLAEIMPLIRASQFGFLLAAGGVGMAIGATFIGQFGQRFPHSQLSLFGSVGMAASLLGLSVFTKQLFPTLGLIALLGSFAAVVGVPMQTTIQEETPEEMRGKIFGLQNNAINIALSLPLALAGVAETFLGLRAVFIGLSALVIAGGIFTWYISRTEPTNP